MLLKLQSTSCKLPLVNGDEFGYVMTSVGDLDNDGVHELVVSAPCRESPMYSYTDAGAVCILFLGIKRIDMHFVLGYQEDRTVRTDYKSSLV